MCIAVCCSGLQWVAVCCSVLQCLHSHFSLSHLLAYSKTQSTCCAIIKQAVLQCVAAAKVQLQCVALVESASGECVLHCVAVGCNTLQHCNTLKVQFIQEKKSPNFCPTCRLCCLLSHSLLPRTMNTLQHNAILCNTLQQTAKHCNTQSSSSPSSLSLSAPTLSLASTS